MSSPVAATKILVIEDQEALREEIVEILMLENFQVLSAANGRDGVTSARQFYPDLIISDVMMPELDGYGVLTELHRDPEMATIPFIFLTARTQQSELRQGMAKGASDYITKPFSRKELLEAIAAQLKKREALDHQVQKQLEVLRTNISLSLPHELHTPLSAIISIADLLIEDHKLLKEAEGLELIRGIRSSAERLYGLTQNFLLHSKLELIASDPTRIEALKANRFTSHTQAVISEVALGIAEKAERLDDLQLELHDVCLLIAGAELRKIVQEIIDNAFKFSTKGTPVQIVSHTDKAFFTLYVINQGRGMTPEQITNIGAYMQFERRQYEQQGAGLGLAIAKRLTELYSGQFIVDSIPNQQTIVKIRLPI